MTWSFPIGRVLGIPIRLHVSWFVVLILVTASFGARLSSSGAGVTVSAVLGLAGAGLLFGSVLLHELGHCVFALRFGIRVRRIQLFIFGGVAEIVGDPRSMRDELVIAAAGPAVSFALAVLFWPLHVWLSPGSGGVLAGMLFLANLGLGLFNLIPAFPMDGGRIFRALLWGATGDYRKATSWAAGFGMAFAGALVLFGIWQFVGPPPDGVIGSRIGGTWIAFIGLFLGRSAWAANAHGRVSAALREGTVSDVTLRMRGVAVPADRPLLEVMLGTTGPTPAELLSGFPVVRNGELAGFVEAIQLYAVPRERWATIRVGEVMTPLARMPRIGLDEPLDALVRLLGEEDGPGALVFHERDLIGYAGRSEVARWVFSR